MAMIIQTAGTELNSLPPVFNLAGSIAAIPGLIGAWRPADLPVGAIATWMAAIGEGVLSQPTIARRPARSDLAGVPAIAGTASTGLLASGAWAQGGPLTVGARVYLSSLATPQYAFGGGDTARFGWNSTLQRFYYDGLPTLSLPGGPEGWYTVIISEDAESLHVQVGDATAAGANAGAQTLGMAIQNSLDTTGANLRGFGWLGRMGKIVIAQSASHGTPRLAAIRSWLEA